MHSPLPTLDALLAQHALNGAIALAFDSQLFDFLALPATALEIAQHHNWQPQQANHLLRLLWSLELLTLEGDCFVLAAGAHLFLCSGSSRFIGDAWRYRHQVLQQFAQQLPQLLTQPASGWQDPLQIDTAWADAALHQIAQEQRALSAETACAIADRLADFQRPALLLDMGGGPGLISIALAERFPQLSAIVFDLPQTATVAQRNIERAGLTHRCCAVPQFPPQRQVDIIWSSSFLYFMEDRQAMLSEWFTRLKPGGLLISAHAEVPDNPAEARQILPFFTPLMMRGYSVTDEGALALALQQAGFEIEETQRMQPFPMSPLNVILARRPKTSD
ncbi:methyltransferase domain-containing protein [Pantoea sp. EA-12]|uniref:class I SAM-dependent methyltransferase n=1 Tax=Pantoea sp. EA-12 TaxID=3043303 RepID=UPI0024B60FDD|nr:class I SAM-dependent methyltransferase [Pantoea sp. EA-12]MDI9219279.1 methyltransferase domain-containing protein [Pantoea sp. EA-12]